MMTLGTSAQDKVHYACVFGIHQGQRFFGTRSTWEEIKGIAQGHQAHPMGYRAEHQKFASLSEAIDWIQAKTAGYMRGGGRRQDEDIYITVAG
jgi:hypothetical protein